MRLRPAMIPSIKQNHSISISSDIFVLTFQKNRRSGLLTSKVNKSFLMKIVWEINIIMHGLSMNRKLLGNRGNYPAKLWKRIQSESYKDNITNLSSNCKEKTFIFIKILTFRIIN